MRLLILTEKYPPIVGGGETQLAQLATGLAKLGYEITIGSDRTGVEGPDHLDGVRIEHVPGLRSACTDLSLLAAVRGVFGQLTTADFDAIHVVNYVPALVLTWLRSAIKTPLFMSAFETYIPGRRVFGMFDDFLLESALQSSVVTFLQPDVVFCGSEAYRRWALEAGFESSQLRVIPHSTDVNHFAFSNEARQKFRSARDIDEDTFVFLVPARPVRRKCIEDALRAFAQLTSERPVRMILTSPRDRGESEYLQFLEQEIHDLGIRSTLLWERDLDWNQMSELYSACDAAVLPSSHEGFGISLLEAMSAERPVIASDIDGPNEFVVPDETGFLYPPGDVPALARSMQFVMNHDVTKVTARALEMVRSRYSIDAMVRGYATAYQEFFAA